MKPLQKIINHIFRHSEFYSTKFKGVNAKDAFQDFSHLEFTSKSELLIDQAQFPPFGSNLCVQPDKIQRVHKTSGTTNKPLYIALTQKDIQTTIRVGANCFISAGLRKNDTVIHCLNYNMWAGGFTDHQSLEKTGAAVIPFGVGNSHNLIETILALKPTAIHCTPSYLRKLELILQNDFQLKPKDLKLKLGLFGAESGLQNPKFRKSIEETWGISAMNANYGLSDVLSMFGAECKYHKGLHFFATKELYPELIDSKSHTPIAIKNNATGELVLTNLIKEAQPLLRYRTNDIIKILSVGKCKCEFSGFTFEVIGRTDDMVVVKGINIFLGSIEKTLLKYSKDVTGVFQVLVNETDPIDRFQIKLELKNSGINQEHLLKILTKDFQDNFNITPEIIFSPEGTMPRSEGKSKKLFRIL